jgi:hypothetical protein
MFLQKVGSHMDHTALYSRRFVSTTVRPEIVNPDAIATIIKDITENFNNNNNNIMQVCTIRLIKSI